MAALRVRVRDILLGACGGEDPDTESFWLTLDGASRAIPALRTAFGSDKNTYLWQPHNLGRYESLDSITNLLYGSGVRA